MLSLFQECEGHFAIEIQSIWFTTWYESLFVKIILE